ncbi:MAG TPA: hypothetical protein VEY92_07965 [Pseudoxanthomonas sp.]|nr:hypothetical protein [Pseudoxanthomonas sp.]
MNDQDQALRNHPQFQYMRGKIQEWVLASAHATDASAGFFIKGRTGSFPEFKAK